MILGFSTHWPKRMQHLYKQPTHFVEKIGVSLKDIYNDYLPEIYKPVGYDINYAIWKAKPKHHTIRQDAANRWKVGMDIHFYINVRKSNQFMFSPVFKVVALQKIEIRHKDQDGFKYATPQVYVDGLWITDPTELAINDGFNSLEDFFLWFNTDFTGKIIHWTQKKY